MFYHINGRFLYTDGHLFVPDGETPPEINGKKLRLIELLAKFLGQNPMGWSCRKRNFRKELPDRIV